MARTVNPITMSNDDKRSAQLLDDLFPAELRSLIEKEQASIEHLKATRDKLLEPLGKHQTTNEEELFTQLTATKQELYSAEQHIQELDHTLQQAEWKDPLYLSKRLDSLEHQTSNIFYLVEVVDVLLKRTDGSVFERFESTVTNTVIRADKRLDTLTQTLNKVLDRLECIELNQVVIAQRQRPHSPDGHHPVQHTEPDKVKEDEESLFYVSPYQVTDTPYRAVDTPYTEHPLFSSSTRPTSTDSPSFSSKIPTGLPAYNPERDGDPEPTSSYLARDVYATHFGSAELQTRLHDEFFKLTHRPREPVRKVIERIDNILQQMTEQPSEAQKIAALKRCLNPCLLESVSNVLLSWNAVTYSEAVQIALSIKANLNMHKTPSSSSYPHHPTSSGHSAADSNQNKQVKDRTPTPSKAYTGQRHNGNNNGSSSSSSSSSGQPPLGSKNTCRKCSAPWHPGHQCKPRQPAALNSSQAQTSSSQQPASAPSPPSSPFPSQASPPSGTNQPSTNALDATVKQVFWDAVRQAWEIQGNVELATIDLNALLDSGNASGSATEDPSLGTPEAIYVESLDTDDDDVEDDCKDKVEPPITAPILLNRQCATAFIDSGASHSFISPAAVEKYLHPASCERHHTVISHINDMEITLGDRSTTCEPTVLQKATLSSPTQFALNQRISRRSDSKPFKLFFSRPLSYPDNYFSSISKLKTPREITSLTKVMLQIVYPSIYEKVAKYSANVERHFNANNKIIHFSSGDKVMLKNSSANSKTNPKFLGPFIIHQCTNNGAYVLQDITGDILPDKVPPSALKLVDPDTPFEDKHFEVEKVLDHDGPPSNRYYLVKWKGYPALDNSWVAAKDFGSQRPISTYWGKKYSKKRRKRR
ncbi:hypothetical protein QOT17_012037 [Balamuthia mandrillaris]